MRVTLSQTFMFEAAHTLDRSDSSRRVHGHTYHAEVSLIGEPDQETGMVVDLGSLRNVCDGIRDSLDHRLLDDVDGLGPATLENLCLFIWARVSRWPAFTSVRVWRADGGSARLSVSASSHTAGQDENSNLAGSEHAAKAGSGENE